MIYEQNCYNLNVKYFDNLIEASIKNIQNNIENLKCMKIFHRFLN